MTTQQPEENGRPGAEPTVDLSRRDPDTDQTVSLPTPDRDVAPSDPTVAWPVGVPYPREPYDPAPAGTARPRSPAAAALLNLTGLALGYPYLRRWWRFGCFLAGTVLLVIVAFATDAASTPWLWRVVAVAWLAWQGIDGWRLARRTPQIYRYRLAPALAAVAVAVVVAGYLLYGVAGRAEYAEGVAAMRAADCAGAVPSFDTVTGPYELTLSRDVPAAAVRRAECVDFQAAQQERGRGAFVAAITAFRQFRTAHPTSDLDPAAARAITEAYAAAVAPLTQGRFCDALPILAQLVALPAPASGPASDDVATRAPADRRRALYECGLAEFRAGRFTAAVPPLQTLVAEYPDDPAVAQARSASIAAQVAGATSDPRMPELPAPFGEVGSERVVVYNSRPVEVRILIAGPTAHELTLPACGGCQDSYPDAAAGCPGAAGRPTMELRLRQGTYETVHSSSGVTSSGLTFDVQAGGGELCTYRLPR